MQARFLSQILRNPRRIFSSRTLPTPPIIYARHRSRPLIASASRYSTVGAQVNADTRDDEVSRAIEDDEQDGRRDYPAKRYPRRTLIVREYDPKLTSLDDLRELLSPYGEIKQMSTSNPRQLSRTVSNCVRSARQQHLLCRVLHTNGGQVSHLATPQPPVHPEQPTTLRQLRCGCCGRRDAD